MFQGIFTNVDFYSSTQTGQSASGAVQSSVSPESRAYPDKNQQVAIVLGYFNGRRYLPEQVRSILDQSHPSLKIFISDDHSDEAIRMDDLGLEVADRHKISLRRNASNVGFVNNFLGTLAAIDSPFAYYAFSDQDDIWYADKIANAIKILNQYPQGRPALYCGRTAITDAHGQASLDSSPLFDKTPSFANALVQNIGGGNTMVFNQAARDIIVKSTQNVDVVSHDWWCYQIVSGVGGIVHYDPKPCLKYRQHAANLVGSNNSWVARLTRLRGLLRGKFRNWNAINLAALAQNRALLTPANQQCLDDFIQARQSGLVQRLFLSRRAGIYRQTLPGNLGLLFGLLINQV